MGSTDDLVSRQPIGRDDCNRPIAPFGRLPFFGITSRQRKNPRFDPRPFPSSTFRKSLFETTKLRITLIFIAEVFGADQIVRLNKCKRELVVFYEPEHTGGRKAYTASARLVDIEADNDKGPGNYFAILGEFRDFAILVPHKIDGEYVELSAASKSGHFAPQNSVRLPGSADFERIFALAG